MTSPLVTIVVNNFNYGRFVGSAIESALSLTYPRVEVIVVDDGSTDDSRQVIERFRNRIKAVFKQNGGQGSTFNVGLRESSGDVIVFLDADDRIDADSLERIMKEFQGGRPVNVHWRLRVIDAKGVASPTIIPPHRLPDGDLRARVIREGPFYDWNCTPPTSGNAWSRTFLDQILPMPEPEYRHGADVYLIALAPLFGEIVTIDAPLGEYRMHGSNNYANRALDDPRLRDYLRRFEDTCSAVARHLAMQGVSADIEAWKSRNFNYLWPTRLLRAKADILTLVPLGGTFILVDGGEWGNGEAVPGRRALPLCEQGGVYWGAPADDETAVQELRRMQQDATHVIFWWTTFWWLGHYPRMHRWLLDHARCVMQSDHIIAFEFDRDGTDVMVETNRI